MKITKYIKIWGGTGKALCRGKFIPQNAHSGKEVYQINDFNYHCKKLRKEGQIKVRRRGNSLAVR